MSTSNNNIYCAPTNITNDDVRGSDSVCGRINDVNVQTIMEEITFAMNGGPINYDEDELVDEIEK